MITRLTQDYTQNIALIDRELNVDGNFDMLKKKLKVGQDEITLYYIDGFVKDTVMQKLMIYLRSLDGLGEGDDAARRFTDEKMPYVEVEATQNVGSMLQMVMSGASLMLGSRFGDWGVIIDSRTYPARETSEPEDDRVMRGPRDGFVETLISNTALIRRRIRDTNLVMSYMSIGSSSLTDVVVCYMRDKADLNYVDKLKKQLAGIRTKSLNMGQQSLTECLIRTHWYDPFPKIRTTERPDTAVAQLFEGSVLVLCDNSPEAMILPTTIFDFLQETNDYYFPPLTGSYLRIVRHVVFWLTLVLIPTWYLLINNPGVIPGWLDFIIPADTGRLPIIVQILLVEFIVDGLRMASMNTPDMLSNSLSIVGGLILGDFAVSIGWLIPEVILYMAFVAIANFTQRNYELGYAFKFMRITMLILTAFFGVWGYVAGMLLSVVLIAINKTVNGRRSYLYPLIPFDGPALRSMLFRVLKRDVSTRQGE
ncbi:MAG: spore germination protein [Eubacteriales bacterium]|nr:spore germination protein [Eubacteriales bacterium]MDY4898492.1 spore germination protein [Eubacteriales bacterium]